MPSTTTVDRSPVATLRHMAADLLDAGEADPHIIAEKMAQDVPTDVLAGAAVQLLAPLVRQVIHDRREMPTEAERAEASQGVTPRYDKVATFYARGQWRPLHEMTAEDVEALASDYRMREAQNATWAARFESLSKLMRRMKVDVVGDLDAETVAQVLS